MNLSQCDREKELKSFTIKMPEHIVRTLQVLYTVMVGLALTEAVRIFVKSIGNKALFSHDMILFTVTFIAFFATVIPFYHGMNVHLFLNHVKRPLEDNESRIIYPLIDIGAFMIMGMILFSMALSIGNVTLFLTLWFILISIDVIWAITVWGYQDREGPFQKDRFGLLSTFRYAIWILWHLLRLSWRGILLNFCGKKAPHPTLIWPVNNLCWLSLAVILYVLYEFLGSWLDGCGFHTFNVLVYGVLFIEIFRSIFDYRHYHGRYFLRAKFSG